MRRGMTLLRRLVGWVPGVVPQGLRVVRATAALGTDSAGNGVTWGAGGSYSRRWLHARAGRDQSVVGGRWLRNR